MAGSLLVVHVHVRVKPGAEEAFRTASVANAEASRREPGVVRFDLLADREDPAHFVLVEVYRDAPRPPRTRRRPTTRRGATPWRSSWPSRVGARST